MPAVIDSGRAKIALKVANNQPLQVNRFVFANIEGLTPETPINMAQGLPSVGQIVYEKSLDAQGYVALDKVVYSTILGPEIGNFTFNWVGLVDVDDTLIAVTYVPPQYKYQTVGLNVGNTLTRNFLTKYNNAQAVTGITVPAEAWQINFLGRMDSVQDQVRTDMADFFGTGFFINNGFLVYANAGSVYATAGVGYVGGLRVENTADVLITTGVLPKDIYIDAYLDADATSSTVVFDLVASPAANPLVNYDDALGNTHYLVKIASVTAGYAVTDHRKTLSGVSHSLMQTLVDLLALKAPLVSPALTGTPTVPTAANGTNTTQAASTAFVQSALSYFLSNTVRKTLTVTTSATVNSGTFYYWVFGKLVFFSVLADVTEGISSPQICTVPAGERPEWETHVPLWDVRNAAANIYGAIKLRVNPAGALYLDLDLSSEVGAGLTFSATGFWRIP